MQVEQFVSKRSYLIAAQIVYFRQHRGMTQAKLAKVTGMKQAAIARLEKTPDLKWSHKTLSRLCAALDMRCTFDFVPVKKPDR